MEAHEWMIKPTYQTEWIDRRGIFLWLALYTGGLGGGLYLVSLFFNSLPGMLTGLLIVAVLKGSFHIAFLGKPLRFWRIMFRPQTSWLARGFIFVVLFVGSATIQVILSYTMPGSVLELLFKIAAGMMAFGVAIYTGFVLNNVKAVSFWNSPLLPLLFIMCGILGGFGLITLIGVLGGDINVHLAETGSRWLLIINVLLIVIYLWTAVKRDDTGKRSVIDQMRGKSSFAFWAGVVVLGIIVPLIVAVFSYFTGEATSAVLIAGVVCEILGGMALRYCILKAGIYKPLFSTPSYLQA